jgi:hypothetical protein
MDRKRDRRDDELLRMSPPIRRGYMDARGSGHVRLMNRQLLLAYAVRTNTKEARHISSFIRGLTCMRMKGKPFVLLDSLTRRTRSYRARAFEEKLIDISERPSTNCLQEDATNRLTGLSCPACPAESGEGRGGYQSYRYLG